MRHRVAGRKLGRTTAHRMALLRNLSTSLFDKEKITTTLAKAKELRPFAEKLITLCKRETLHARRQVLRHIHDREVVAKMFDTISARYAQRPGGYTRIVKLGPRRGDNAEMAVIELVEAEVPEGSGEQPAKTKKKSPRKKRAVSPKKRARGKGETAAEEAEPKKRVSRKKSAAKKKAAAKKTASKKSAEVESGDKPKRKPTRKKTTRRSSKKTAKGGDK